VLAVVLYHVFPKAVHGGRLCRPLDLLCHLGLSDLLHPSTVNGGGALLDCEFYSRRIRRIFPALAVCLAAVLAYGFVRLLPLELVQVGKHVFFNAAFLPNIAIWSEAGYFDLC
jgi:peptidoglycan/LPS O-acetylase OafA/YrhL